MDGAVFSPVLDDPNVACSPAPGQAPASVASLDRLPTPQAWDELAAAAVEPNPFHERWFLRPSFRFLGEAGTRLLTVWEDERLLGLLPVCSRRGYARMPIRIATNWAHFHHFLGTPLVRTGREADFWRAALPAMDGLPDADVLHLSGQVEGGPVLAALLTVAREAGRPAEIVHREARALYAPRIDGRSYYETVVRKKKRKEIGRLQNRLAELGDVRMRILDRCDDVAPWTDDFLALEAAGWKGAAGSALGSRADTRAFFSEVVAAAHARGRLDFARLDLDGRPAAMLCTFMGASGGEGFSYKIAYDEGLARFSPGVLLQIANLDLPERRGLTAVDSCAVEDHPMINSLWAERRTVARVTLARDTRLSRATFRFARAAERGAARWRARMDSPQ